MTSTFVAVSFSSSQLFPVPAVVINGARATSCCRLNLFNIMSCPRVKSRGPISKCPFAAKSWGVRVHSKISENLNELWEDPNHISDSDEEAEENDWEAEKDVVKIPNRIAELSTSNYEEDLLKEVEQLLEPEEIAILQHNKTPDLEKLSTSKWNPLHTFALAGQIPYMDQLLKDGLGIDLVDKDGLTALHLAIIGKKEAVISHLLRKGANLHARDLDGATPLHYAVQVCAIQTVKLLIKHKVDVNISDNEGWTPLHVAVQTRNRDIVKLLLVNGADKNMRNKDDKTPLDLSLCYGKDFKSYDLARLVKLLPANR